MGSLVKIIVLLFVPLVVCQLTENNQQTQQQLEDSPEQHEILDIEAPETFSFSASPLQQPESLQSKPYFDFLSELYAHDEGKKSLFANPPKIST
ncbi:uncharacterized protein LOC129952219 isoform X2 [Eupeodes corollae]|uniref:uncharacterized protein LOC129952219 isoform X2 n=1 Tax=Eupeodes corollae TaxID=290404 RepID=UPI002492E72D|nr:uncharacterized protein LOC129952219 isoform X2 [Eupeodes corollae]